MNQFFEQCYETASSLVARVSGLLFLTPFLVLFPGVAAGQQFNSDNHITMPKGVSTIILTGGQRSSTALSVFALANHFELNVGVNIFPSNHAQSISAHYSTILYGKYTFWANKANSGGFSVIAGTGGNPGYLERDGLSNSARTYFVNFPTTLPLLNNKFSIDFVPGTIANLDYGETRDLSWGFTHSTRAVWNKAFLKTSIVGEIYGTLGGAYTTPEYKAGLRWEPNDNFVGAVTYSQALNGGKGAGFEIGVMIFTPAFICRGGCK